jgi:transposase
MWGCRPRSWPDPRYDWPECLWADLSAIGLGRCVLPPVRWACPDRGLAATRHHHSPGPPCRPDDSGHPPRADPGEGRMTSMLPSCPVQPGRCRRQGGDPGGRYPHRHPRGRGAGPCGCAARQPLGCSYRRRLPAAARLGAGVGDAPGRAGVRVHRLLRGGAQPPLAGRRRDRSLASTSRTRPSGAEGKTDPIDAEAAARAVLAGRATAAAKTGDGPVEGARMFKLATDAAVKSLHPGGQPAPRPCWWPPTQRRASRWLARQPGTHPPMRAAGHLPRHRPTSAAGWALPLLTAPDRVAYHPGDRRPQRQHHRGGDRPHPQLLECNGVGPDTAATLLITAGDNPSGSAARLAWPRRAAPARSRRPPGKTQRRRPDRGGDRGGDRQAGAALYRIALSRLRWDHRTRDYLDRRTAEGKTPREAIRCPKHYLARELYQLITKPQPTPITDPQPLDIHRGISPSSSTPATASRRTSMASGRVPPRSGGRDGSRWARRRPASRAPWRAATNVGRMTARGQTSMAGFDVLPMVWSPSTSGRTKHHGHLSMKRGGESSARSLVRTTLMAGAPAPPERLGEQPRRVSWQRAPARISRLPSGCRAAAVRRRRCPPQDRAGRALARLQWCSSCYRLLHGRIRLHGRLQAGPAQSRVAAATRVSAGGLAGAGTSGLCRVSMYQIAPGRACGPPPPERPWTRAACRAGPWCAGSGRGRRDGRRRGWRPRSAPSPTRSGRWWRAGRGGRGRADWSTLGHPPVEPHTPLRRGEPGDAAEIGGDGGAKHPGDPWRGVKQPDVGMVGAEPPQLLLAGVDLGLQVVDQRQRGSHVASPRRGQVKAGKQRPAISAEQVGDRAGMPKRQRGRVDWGSSGWCGGVPGAAGSGPAPARRAPQGSAARSGGPGRVGTARGSTRAPVRSVLHASGASPLTLAASAIATLKPASSRCWSSRHVQTAS